MPPTQQHLSRVYAELAKYGARALGRHEEWPYEYDSLENLISLAADMSRYDPRLFSILVEFLFFHWQQLNPLKMRAWMSQQGSPQTILVMMSFVASAVNKEEVDYFLEYLAKGYSPVDSQLYFIGLHLPGSHGMDRMITEPLSEFSTWGFLARERPIIHGAQRIVLGEQQ